MLDDVGVDVVEEAAGVFGCGVFGVEVACVVVFVGCFVSCCGFEICIGVELDVEDWLGVMSFCLVTGICIGRRLSSSSIGVMS